MSTPVADNKSAAEEQVPKAEEKQETSTASNEDVQVQGEKGAIPKPSTDTAESTAAEEVDSSSDETKPEAASGEEATPAEGDSDTNANADTRVRRNGATRKRYKWLLEQGYSPEEAADKAKEPLKVQELEAYKNLSGAAKKRFNWLLKNGHTDMEALKMAREPMSASKRNLSANSASPTNKVTKAGVDPAGGMVMAVAVMDYPNSSFTKAQANEFKSAILKEVIAQKDSELKPHFQSCTYVKGYLRVHCLDEDTRRWLQRVVAKLAVPEGMAKLKISGERNLLKGDIYTAFFPDSRTDTNEAILEFVESQNESIDTSKWKILARKEVKNKQVVELTFTLDMPSAKTLASLGYELNYKFNKIKIRKQTKSGDGPTNPNQRPVPNMGPPHVRGPFQQLQQRPPMNFNVWDRNYGQNRVDNNFNRFDNARNSFGSSSVGYGWSNGSNSLGLGGGPSNNKNSNNSFASSNPFANAIASAGQQRGGGFQSNSDRPYNSLIESLYDQLQLIGGGNANNSNMGGMGGSSNSNTNFNANNNFGQRHSVGGAGDNNSGAGTSSNYQWGRNTGNQNSGPSSYSGRSSNSYYGNRSFFTTTRTGFF